MRKTFQEIFKQYVHMVNPFVKGQLPQNERAGEEGMQPLQEP